MRVLIVHNARVASSRLTPFLDACAGLGVRPDVRVTRSAGEAAAAAHQAVASGCDLVVASGGDGTVLSVLDALADAETALLPLPFGTSNDAAVHLGIPTLAEACEALKSGTPRRLALAEASYRTESGGPVRTPFLTTAGVGLFGALCRHEQRPLWERSKRSLGNAVWPALFVAGWRSAPVVPVRLTIDGRTDEAPAKGIEVMRVRAAGGVVLAPGASLSRDSVSVLRFRPVPFVRMLGEFVGASLRPGFHIRSGAVEHFHGDPAHNACGWTHPREVAVDAAIPLPVHVHGDPAGTTPATFALTARTLAVHVPARTAL